MKTVFDFSDEEKFFLKLNAAAFTVGALIIALGKFLEDFSGFLSQF